MRQRKIQLYSVGLLLCFCLALQGCDRLKTLAKTCRSIEVATEEVFADVKQMRQDGVLTQEEANQVITLNQKVAIANDEANSVLLSIATLDPNSKVKVLMILKPILQALDNGLQAEVFGIKNSQARARVSFALTAIRSSLDLAIQLSS